jgi:hypothetical protein
VGPTRPRIKLVTGTPSLGVELSRHDANHSPPYGTGVGNKWGYTSILPHAFMERVRTALSRRFLKKVADMGVSYEGQNLYSLCSRPFRRVATFSEVTKNTDSIDITLSM